MTSKGPKRTLLIGPRAHSAVSGVRLGFEMLCEEFAKRKLPHAVVDLGVGGTAARAGSLQPRRIIISAAAVLSLWFKLVRVRQVYMTIASSLPGFLRDALIIWPSRLFRRRLILHLKGGGYQDFYRNQPEWLKRFIRLTLDQADAIIILGELLRDQFAFVSNAGAKLRVIPNGLPPDLCPETAIVKTLPRAEPLRLLYLSNLIESKGYLDVLSACRILLLDYQLPIHCDFCGNFISPAVGPKSRTPQAAQENFLGWIRDWKLEAFVSYRGTVAGETKRKILADAHIFILPTSYLWEGQPISIIEALAFGTPVISTCFRGIPEQIIDGYNGFFVKANSPGQIAETVLRMEQDPVLYEQMSRNAIRHYLANFTPEVHLERLTSVILGCEQANLKIQAGS